VAERDMIEDIPITAGSGNVFADLNLPNAADELFRADLVRQTIHSMQQRRLTPARMATLLGVAQSDVAQLIRGHYEGYSTDRLLQFLTSLGLDVEIVLTPTERAHGETRVRVAS
jgi:predicted XRE-type DNA-binding protein